MTDSIDLHRYTLNVNEGVDTIHRDPREECNLDDSKGRESVDAKSALSLILNGHARRCAHCWDETAT